jgi:hypothetical protein
MVRVRERTIPTERPLLVGEVIANPVPDPLLLFGSAGNRTRASGSVAKNSDH